MRYLFSVSSVRHVVRIPGLVYGLKIAWATVLWLDFGQLLWSITRKRYDAEKSLYHETHLLGVSSTGQNESNRPKTFSVRFGVRTRKVPKIDLKLLFWEKSDPVKKKFQNSASTRFFGIPDMDSRVHVKFGENQWRGSDQNDAWYTWRKKTLSSGPWERQNVWAIPRKVLRLSWHSIHLPSFVQIDLVSAGYTRKYRRDRPINEWLN